MRFVAAVAAILVAAAAHAATPEESYIAARDKAMAQMKKLEAAGAGDKKIQAAEKAAQTDLLKRLTAIVGPLAVQGFATTPKLNLEALGDSPGNGMLDGLAFAVTPAKEDGARLVVTTRPLFSAWLKARAAESETGQPMPATLEDALRADIFYTFAVGEDAAFSRAAEIEVEKPAGADFAFAGLGRWSQDIGPGPLDRLVAAVVKGGRVFVADVEAAEKPAETPACKALWDKASAEAEKLNDAYQKGGAKDDKLFERSTKAQEKGAQEWLACEGKAIKAGASYPALKGEAQNLVARMAGG